MRASDVFGVREKESEREIWPDLETACNNAVSYKANAKQCHMMSSLTSSSTLQP